VTFNDVEFKACPRCGVEPAIKDVRVRSLTEPNVMSVTCSACGMYESVTWGSMGLPPFGRAVRELAKRWGGRRR
jgi:hypothetical protein